MSLSTPSYWEIKSHFSTFDFMIVGAGLVGMSTAFHLKKKYKDAKVVIVDKALLSDAASSKNAGFACFGSPSELLDDLATIPKETVWKTLEKRWKGLEALDEWLDFKQIGYEQNGSWDLITVHSSDNKRIDENLDLLNKALFEITDHREVFSSDMNSIHKFGMKGIKSAYKNRLEGQIDVSLLNQRAKQKLAEVGVEIWRNISVESWEEQANKVFVNTNIGQLSSQQLIICTNGFSKAILPQLDIEPARAQVLITEPIADLNINGTFHLEGGYYYFRNIDNRILLGGGRNLDFKGENTSELGTSDIIQDKLHQLLREVILPHNKSIKVAHTWSGIMGVGQTKSPIAERLSKRISIGIRMGGMGIAIGTQIGRDLVKLQN